MWKRRRRGEVGGMVEWKREEWKREEWGRKVEWWGYVADRLWLGRQYPEGAVAMNGGAR